MPWIKSECSRLNLGCWYLSFINNILPTSPPIPKKNLFNVMNLSDDRHILNLIFSDIVLICLAFKNNVFRLSKNPKGLRNDPTSKNKGRYIKAKPLDSHLLINRAPTMSPRIAPLHFVLYNTAANNTAANG